MTMVSPEAGATGEPLGYEPAVDETPMLPHRRHVAIWTKVRDVLPLVGGALLILLALFGTFIVPYSPIDVVDKPDLMPSGTHLFGTDSAGMDVFSRTIAAVGNNLLIGLLTTLAATGIGIAVGLFVGMQESSRGLVGLLSRALARAIDLVQAVPAIVIGLVLLAFFGASVISLSIALTVVLLPNQARLVRTEVLRVRGEAYLDAARISGEPEYAVIARHVLPNASWPALENASLVFASAIVLTAGLGFLGVGLNPPTPEWGSMISSGAPAAAAGRWWAALFPALALALTVTIVTGIGQRLFNRDSAR